MIFIIFSVEFLKLISFDFFSIWLIIVVFFNKLNIDSSKYFNLTLREFIDSNAFLYEPTFLWQDEQTIYHKKVYPLDLKNVPTFERNPEGFELVHEIKDRLEDMARNNGAIHFQIGKDYPYLKTRTESTRKLLVMLKRELDPKNLINPGNLGFDENN